MGNAIPVYGIDEVEHYRFRKVVEGDVVIRMYLLSDPVVRIHGVRDERPVDIVIEPCSIVEKHHLLEHVMGVERVDRDRNAFRTLIAFFVVFIFVIFIDDAVIVVLVDIYIYGVVDDESVL